MRLWDPNYKGHRLRYLAQIILATMTIFIVLIFLDVLKNAALVAALGASTFIAFCMPHTNSSMPRYMIGGYVVGILAGTLCNIILSLPVIQELQLQLYGTNTFFYALAIGISMFIMVVTDTEHPPAAGIALGLSMNEFNLQAILVVSIGIVLLATTKSIMKPYLIDLI